MSQQSVRGPLAIANLDDMDWFDPGRSLDVGNLLGWQRIGATLEDWSRTERSRANQRIEHRLQLAKQGIVEAGADASRIHQLAIHVIGELKRTHMSTTALWRGETNDHEIASRLGFYLQPVRRASLSVGTISFLGDDALESQRHHALHECLTLAFDVIEYSQRSELRDDSRQELLSLEEREPAEIEILESQDIERIERRRQLNRRVTYIYSSGQPSAPLKVREAGKTFFVANDHLAVDDTLVDRQCFHCARDLRKNGRVVVPVACQKQGLAR